MPLGEIEKTERQWNIGSCCFFLHELVSTLTTKCLKAYQVVYNSTTLNARNLNNYYFVNAIYVQFPHKMCKDSIFFLKVDLV